MKKSPLSQQELERQTQRLARDLAFVVRAPVTIQLVGGNHIAYTLPSEQENKGPQVTIVMNPNAVDGIRNRERALEVWRGIGIHEICHHLWPAVPQYKQAFQEQFKDLYNLLDDEQIERRARALNPEWGGYLQSVVAHVFDRKSRDSQELPQGFTESDRRRRRPARGLAATLKYAQRFNQFAFYFRRQITDSAPGDPLVAQALELIPRRLKDLTKDELLELARQVQEILLTGIELPKIEQPEPKPEPPESEAGKEGEEGESSQEEPSQDKPEDNPEQEQSQEPIDDGEPDIEPEPEEQEEPSSDQSESPEDAESTEDEEDEQDEDFDEEEDQAEPQPSGQSKKKQSKGSWRLKRLLRSKTMGLIGLLFIALWCWLLMKKGVNFWFEIAIDCVIGLGIIGTILYLRRKFIKNLLKKFSPPTAPSPTGATKPPPKRLLSFNPFTLVLAALVVFGGVEIIRLLFHALTLQLAFVLACVTFAIGCLGYARSIRTRARTSSAQESDRFAKLAIPALFIGALYLMVKELVQMGGSTHIVVPVVAFIGLLLLIGIGLMLLFKVEPVGGTSAGTTGTGSTATTPVGPRQPRHYLRRFLKLLRIWMRNGWRRTVRVSKRTGKFCWKLTWSPAKFLGRHFGRFIALLARHFWSVVRWAAPRIWHGIVVLAKLIWKAIVSIALAIAAAVVFLAVHFWHALCAFGRTAKRVLRWLYWKLEPHVRRAWRHPVLRLFLVALPAALIAVMIYAFLYTAGKFSWWLLLILIIILLLLLLLGFLNRKRIAKFVVQELFMPMPDLMQYMMQVPLDMTTEWFNRIDNIVPVEANALEIEQMMPLVDALGQELRPYFQRCGRVLTDLEDQPDGFDLTDEAELALVGETSIFVNDHYVPKASVHIEVGVDCSGSMASATQSLRAGQKFELAKFFALVLERAVVGLPGVSAHFWGFTDTTIYDCGVPGEGRITGLPLPNRGNNDSAMLWHMGQSAAESNAEVKILFMLSDGMPSDCSWLSLHNLVLQYEQEGMIPWQVALDIIPVPAFERFVTDLVGQSADQAIVTMKETFAEIAEQL